MQPTRRFALHSAFFLSGAAALAYEAAWGRLLHRVLGVSDLAVASVVAAFFLGLGLGAAAGGIVAPRLRRPLRVYAALEIAIAAWALLSTPLADALARLYATLGAGTAGNGLTETRFALALALLLPPTCLLGATLPIVIARVARTADGWTAPAAALYATNTLGGAVGAAMAGFVLLPSFGIRATLFAAAGGSSMAAAIVLAAHRNASVADDPPPKETRPAREDAQGGGAVLAALLAGAAGFAALAGEVLFTRALRLVVQGTMQAFAAMLAIYLVGIALGGALAHRWTKRLRHPSYALAATQGAAAALVLLAMGLVPQVPRLFGWLHRGRFVAPHEPLEILATAAVLLLPIATAVGATIPIAWSLAPSTGATAPATAGRVLAANTLGGLAGATVAGLVAIPSFGIARSLAAVAALHVLVAAAALVASPTRRGRRVILALGLPIAAALVAQHAPPMHLPFLLDAWSRPERAVIDGPSGWPDEDVVFLEEGRSTTVTVLARENALRLFNDGRPESGFGAEAPGFGPEVALLGALPALFRDARERAFVVGLGAGHTTTTLLAAGFEHVEVVEIEPAIVRAARAMHRRKRYPFPLDDARAELLIDDARVALAVATEHRYDAIVSQPSHPWLAGGSDLFTREHFASCKRALRPGGVLVQWVNLFRMDVRHLRRVLRTVLDVFPHAVAFVPESSSFVILAGDAPFEFDGAIDLRIADAPPALLAALDPLGLASVLEILRILELDDRGAHAFARGAEPLTDDLPALEHGLARLAPSAELALPNLDDGLRAIPWVGAGTLAGVGTEDAFAFRIDETHARRGALGRVEAAAHASASTPESRALLEGLLREARGDVRGALAAYDASASPLAAFRADRLRGEERAFRELLRVAGARAVAPLEVDPIIAAALHVDDVDAARAAMSTGEPARFGDAALEGVARAWTNEGCEGLLRAARASETPSEPIAWAALRCSLVARPDDAAPWGDAWARANGRYAHEQAALGREADRAGNAAAAAAFYRRALRANPDEPTAKARLPVIRRALGLESAPPP